MSASPIIFETVASQEYRKQYAGGELVAEWVVWYESTFPAAEALLWDTISDPLTTTFGNLEVKSVAGRNLGAPDLWLFTVTYGSSVPSGKLRPDQLSFRIAANRTHITQSIATLDQRIQADANVHGTNLTVDGITDTDVAPDGYTPVAGDVGKYLAITGGTGWTTGIYQIASLTLGSKWRLNAVPAAAGTNGGTWTFLNGTGVNFGGAIGVSLDSVQGCDINVPALEFSLSQNYSGGIGLSDLIAFRALVGTINDAPCGPFATGTLEYLGCEPTSPDGSMEVSQNFIFWSLAHRFVYEPDVFGVKLGPFTIAYKPGHAYLWVRYAPQVAGTVLTNPPQQVNVEQVKLYGDFSTLGITAF